ncbi:MAG: DOMON-like domain-containing protein [Methylotetracoccus sp.]
MNEVELLAHPDTPCVVIRRLSTCAAWRSDGRLSLRYVIDADTRNLRFAKPGGGRRRDELWRHTCFEAFLRSEDAPGYVELNFSTSGDWAAYGFSGYRAGMSQIELPVPPVIRVDEDAGRLVLTTEVSFPPFHGTNRPPTRAGLTAVIEDVGGALSYWSAAHAPGKPDFHEPASMSYPIRRDDVARGAAA